MSHYRIVGNGTEALEIVVGGRDGRSPWLFGMPGLGRRPSPEIGLHLAIEIVKSAQAL